MPDDIQAVGNLQRFRKFVIAQELSIIQRLTALVASCCGYEARDEEGRGASWDRAEKIVREALGKCDLSDEDGEIVDAIMPEVQATKAALEPFQGRRKQIEKRMGEIAKGLPGQRLIEATKGFKHIGLAVIVGEAGDLTNYSTIRKLWRRLGFGMAPGHEAHAYSTWRMKGGLTADDWTAAGYSPKRLGQIYGVVTVPLFMCKAKNRYGAIYTARRERTAITHPDWTKGHSDMDARRVMTKAFISDLWSEWRGSDEQLESIHEMAPATINAAETPLQGSEIGLDASQRVAPALRRPGGAVADRSRVGTAAALETA